MQQATLYSLIASILVFTLAVQVPLGSNHRRNQAITSDGEFAEWNFKEFLGPDTTNHLVFETVYSLLQHWPNTRMRNGHNVVPGVIPKGTLLYHGAKDDELPIGPEWVATDPEHAYLFCQYGLQTDDPTMGCWQLTLTTTRPLKILYFDGSSAAKVPGGSMDTGDLLAWDEIPPPDHIFDEWKRAEDLCRWGKKINVDGFVRMEVDL